MGFNVGDRVIIDATVVPTPPSNTPFMKRGQVCTIVGIDAMGNLVLENYERHGTFRPEQFCLYNAASPASVSKSTAEIHVCNFIRYNGFTDVFDYCPVCDNKRGVAA